MSMRFLACASFTLLIIAAILLVGVLLFNKWLKYKERSMAFALKQDNNKALASLRVTAYERITIMLERMTPQALVMRISPTAATAGNLQMQLIKAIREEFDHNVSLQIYVSQDCWMKVAKAKDDVSELIKVAFTKVSPDSPAMELSRAILLLEQEVGNPTIQQALLAVRQEMLRHF
jgi:hypothetical protein